MVLARPFGELEPVVAEFGELAPVAILRTLEATYEFLRTFNRVLGLDP
jgi:hypothetical protein